MYSEAILWQLSCNSTGVGIGWEPLCVAVPCSPAFSHSEMLHVSAAVTMTAASRPYQLLPDTSDLILLSPRYSQPTTPFPYSTRPTVVSFLYARAQSQVARKIVCLASKGTIITVCFLVRLGAVFLLVAPLLKLGGQGPLSSCFLHLKSFTSKVLFQILGIHKSKSQRRIISSAFLLLCQPAQLQ